MGRSCCKYEGQEVPTGVWWGDLMVRDNFEDMGTDWTLILKWIFKKWYGKA